MKLAFLPLAALALLTACAPPSLASATPTSTRSAEPTPLARPSGQLDQQVPMPGDFPGDVPLYPKARLTAGASFISSGQASWGMEWETLDSVARVQAFYTGALNKGDWTMQITAASSGTFAATFSRRSNAHVLGTLTSNGSSGVTKILMSLLEPTA